MTVYDITGYYGLVRVRGATRLDFMHRMSSGALDKLKPGSGASTCFTSTIARIIDHSVVLCDADSALLLTGGGNEEKLTRWLRKYIFFNDDVQLSIETAGQYVVACSDADIPEMLRAAPNCTHREHDGARWVRLSFGPTPIALRIGTAPVSTVAQGLAAFDALRIALGVPRFPNEIGEDYIPLETGLLDSVSFTKGCYIGQEIIARMDSRNQLSKKLQRLRVVSGSVANGDALLIGADTVGKVTSVAGEHALGYVRTVAIETGRIFSTPSGALQLA